MIHSRPYLIRDRQQGKQIDRIFAFSRLEAFWIYLCKLGHADKNTNVILGIWCDDGSKLNSYWGDVSVETEPYL